MQHFRHFYFEWADHIGFAVVSSFGTGYHFMIYVSPTVLDLALFNGHYSMGTVQ